MSAPRPTDDDVLLLCLPLRPGHGPVTAGSLRKLCDICNQPVAASRASLDAVIGAATEKNVKWWLVCLHCAPDIVPKDSEFMPPTAQQAREIEGELRKRAEAEEDGEDA